MSKPLVITSYLLALVLAGCGLTDKVMSKTEPAKPPINAIDGERLKLYSTYSSSTKLGLVPRYRHDYDLSVLENRPEIPERERNKIIFEMMGVIDESYLQFKEELRLGKAGKDILTDFILLGLNAAGTVMGGESLKAILAATSAGVVGASSSVDKNYLMSNTILAIIGQMEASRAEAATAIYKGITQNAKKYPLDAARRDIFKYYEAGTLTNALIALSTTVEASKNSVSGKLNTAIDAYLAK